jgi:hypothetical protein
LRPGGKIFGISFVGGGLSVNETLIQTLKRYYADYRTLSEPIDSFAAALEALPYHVIDKIEELVQAGRYEDIKRLVREFREIHESTYGSNDSVLERFEEEYVEMHTTGKR